MFLLFCFLTFILSFSCFFFSFLIFSASALFRLSCVFFNLFCLSANCLAFFNFSSNRICLDVGPLTKFGIVLFTFTLTGLSVQYSDMLECLLICWNLKTKVGLVHFASVQVQVEIVVKFLHYYENPMHRMLASLLVVCRLACQLLLIDWLISVTHLRLRFYRDE